MSLSLGVGLFWYLKTPMERNKWQVWRLYTYSWAPRLLKLWEIGEIIIQAIYQTSFIDHLWKWLCTFPKLGVARVQKRIHLILTALPDPFVYLFDLILSLSFIIIIDVDLSMTPFSMFHCSECVLEASRWFHVQSPPLLIFTSQNVVLKKPRWP